ncbi:MAG TPA: hypothetical protein VGB15_09930 [Longimicrobium sp.]|jgi:hypothetical protein
MSKLTLDLDALQVDSFGTSNAVTAERGTVHGNAMSKMSCPVATDPCICDPIHLLTEKGC